METVTLTAKKGKDGEPVSQAVEMPENLNEAIELWGDEETFSMAKQQKVIRLQASMRRPKGGKQAEELYNRLVTTGRLSEEQCRQISGYAGATNS